ncbi:molybdopterin converting factor subunit 1 [Tepidamorphus sp. 3E244]|uniref:molybdopterin converting factor subunit 1 n=1 Tax=Tepidamorphus sp. 3E244 TaxID=3385498 RepID=UPI0038FC52C6
MKLRYFAWVRERIGASDETVELPGDVSTVAQLLDWQKTRGEEYAHAFEQSDVIRVAIDQMHVTHDTPLTGASEIAFFPPMTGG